MEDHKAVELPKTTIFGQRSATILPDNLSNGISLPLIQKDKSGSRKRSRVDSVNVTSTTSTTSPAPKRRKLLPKKVTLPSLQPLPSVPKKTLVSKEKNIFTINETRKLPTKLKEYEDILCSYCLMLYKLCSSNTTKLSEDLPEITYPPLTMENDKEGEGGSEYDAMNRALSLGKTKKEKHLAKALYHLEQVLDLEGTFFDDYVENNDVRKTKTLYRNLQQSSAKVLAHLSTITNSHLEANKICKKSITVLKQLNEILTDWDRWKIQYISELRVHYDPTLCGGISKPTLDVFSAQSNASKMRLGVVEKLALRREELIKELQQVESQLTTTTAGTVDNIEALEKRTNVTNDLLNVTASSMEISRNEREIQHLDTQDKISFHLAERYQVPYISRVNGTLSTTVASATYRHDRQRRVEAITNELIPSHTTVSKVMSSGTIEISEEDDSEEDEEMTTAMKGTGMPSLSAPVRVNPVPPTRVTSNKTSGGVLKKKRVPALPPANTRFSKQQSPRVSFGFNSVRSIDVTWDKDSYDVPLDKVNWASKTTVRMPQNLKF